MSNHSAQCTTHPDAPARRLRSMLVGASSLTLLACGHRADVIARHSMDRDGKVRLKLPADSRLTAEISREREVVAMIEFTDLAPTPVRDRVRGRGTLTGWLVPADPHGVWNGERDLTVVLDLATAELGTAEGTADVDPAEFAVAEPDPLAAIEADLLCHLDRHHPHTVQRLCRLVDPRHLYGVQRVTPVQLDRYGLVMRLEHASRHRDVRLGFAPALRRADELNGQMSVLLNRSANCHSRRRGS